MSLSPSYSQSIGYSYAASSARREWSAMVSTSGGTAAASLSSSSGVLMKNRTDARTRSSQGVARFRFVGLRLLRAVVMVQVGF